MGPADDEAAPLLGARASGAAGPRRGSSKTRSAALLAGAAARSRDAATAARMSEVIAELEKDAAHNTLWVGFAVVSIVNHFVGGVFTLHVLEGWGVADALYFAVVVTTTVGYGDLAPKRTLGKLYMCYFVFAAVSMISTCLAYTVGLLIDKQEELLMQSLVGAADPADPADVEAGAVRAPGAAPGAPTSGGGAGGMAAVQRAMSAAAVWLRAAPVLSRASDYAWLDDVSWLADYSQAGVTAALFLAIIAVGVGVFMKCEGLAFVDALYVTCISATTVGFGDIGPTARATKSIMTVWLVVSTLTLGKLITDQSDAYVRSRQRAVTRRLLNARMDRSTLTRMDGDGDGKVDKAEFLRTVLVQMGKVQQADVDECLRRFKELDKDGSGLIDPEDIER